jgi:hypothetical protein
MDEWGSRPRRGIFRVSREYLDLRSPLSRPRKKDSPALDAAFHLGSAGRKDKIGVSRARTITFNREPTDPMNLLSKTNIPDAAQRLNR